MTAAAQVLGADMPKVLTIHSPAVLEQAWNWTHGTLLDLAKLPGLPIIRRFEQQSIAVSTVCHSLSYYTRDCVSRMYPDALRIPWRVIPHWIDEAWVRSFSKQEARRLLGWSADAKIILTVRQLKPRYGIDWAIRALSPLLSAGVEFRVVGDGPQRRWLEEVARAGGVENAVMFEGAVPDDRLRLAYQAADAFVIPSRSLECFGLIALEAIAVGLPTVATRVGALPEILGPVSPERLVMAGDGQALRGEVARILDAVRSAEPCDDPMVVASAQSRYDHDRVVLSYEQLFDNAIAAA